MATIHLQISGAHSEESYTFVSNTPQEALRTTTQLINNNLHMGEYVSEQYLNFSGYLVPFEELNKAILTVHWQDELSIKIYTRAHTMKELIFKYNDITVVEKHYKYLSVANIVERVLSFEEQFDIQASWNLSILIDESDRVETYLDELHDSLYRKYNSANLPFQHIEITFE